MQPLLMRNSEVLSIVGLSLPTMRKLKVTALATIGVGNRDYVIRQSLEAFIRGKPFSVEILAEELHQTLPNVQFERIELCNLLGVTKFYTNSIFKKYGLPKEVSGKRRITKEAIILFLVENMTYEGYTVLQSRVL